MIDQNEPCCFPGGRLLVLRAVDVTSEWRWRWLLSGDGSGRPLADHAIVREAPGWDVLHLSGHGTVGAFWLEGADGSPDLVAVGELTGLLRPARRRVKLAVLSACESAAGMTARTLRLIGLDEQAQAIEAAQPGAAQPGAGQSATAPAEVTGLARLLVAELGCAVVGMRYPVLDEFAIGFGEQFYGELLRAGQPVDVAAARAVPVAAGNGHGGWPVSVAGTGRAGAAGTRKQLRQHACVGCSA